MAAISHLADNRYSKKAITYYGMRKTLESRDQYFGIAQSIYLIYTAKPEKELMR